MEEVKKQYNKLFDSEFNNFQCKLITKEKIECPFSINEDKKGFKVGTYDFPFTSFMGCNIEDSEGESAFVIYFTTHPKFYCGFGSEDKENLNITPTKFYLVKEVETNTDSSTLKTLRNYVMTTFNQFLVNEYGSGIKDHSSAYEHTAEYSWEKKILVFISPASGKGNAEKNYKSIEPALLASGYLPKIVRTEYQYNARDYIKNLPKEEFVKYYQIVICGGDGMVNEVINGFHLREKVGFFESNVFLRLGMLAGGSACAAMSYACSLWGLKSSPVNG